MTHVHRCSGFHRNQWKVNTISDFVPLKTLDERCRFSQTNKTTDLNILICYSTLLTWHPDSSSFFTVTVIPLCTAACRGMCDTPLFTSMFGCISNVSTISSQTLSQACQSAVSPCLLGAFTSASEMAHSVTMATTYYIMLTYSLWANAIIWALNRKFIKTQNTGKLKK